MSKPLGYSRLTADIPHQIRDLLRATALMKRISLRTLITRYLVEGLKREGQIVKIEEFITILENNS